MNCSSQGCNAEVKRIFFSTRPVFQVPTFEVGASDILDFEGHGYVEKLQMFAQMNYLQQLNAIRVK